MLPDADHLPTITTARLRLRWLTPADVPALFDVFGDPAVCRYWSSPALADLAAAAALREQVARLFAERSLFQWGIAERDTDRVIGTCTLAALSAEHRRAEVGFALAQARWGRGYLAEALPALLDFAFDTLGLHRIEADVDPRNAPSLRALERAGFRREGYLRERYHVAGEVQDAVLLGLLRAEWAARPQPDAAEARRAMHVPMRVRPYVPADHAEWLRMRRALWPHHAIEDEAADAAEWLERADTVVLVAERPGGAGLAGFAELGERAYADCCLTSPVGYLEGWYVDEDVRRTGVGAALVRAGEAWARAKGYRELGSDALLDNHVSHRAHRALGFSEEERLVIFRKPL